MGCHKGCIPWNKGKTGCYSDETRKKISVALEGKKKPPRSAEQRKHYSDAQKKLWDDPEYRENQIIKGKARFISPEQRAVMIAHSKETTSSSEYKLKMSEMGKAQKDNAGRFKPGHKLTDEYKEVLRKRFTGENNPLWKGGISFEPYCPKFNLDLKRRIRAFFDHECVMCGKSAEESGEELSCHHVEYDKQACCDGKPVHFVALCRGCHTKTTISLDRQRWENMLHIIIDEVYNGRSYYTKAEWSKIR